mgnify:CR=1 FL=1
MSSWGITPIYPTVRLLIGTTIPYPSTWYNCTALSYIWYNYTVPFHGVQLYGIVLHMTVLCYPTTVPAFCSVQLSYPSIRYNSYHTTVPAFNYLLLCYRTTVSTCSTDDCPCLCYRLSYIFVLSFIVRV